MGMKFRVLSDDHDGKVKATGDFEFAFDFIDLRGEPGRQSGDIGVSTALQIREGQGLPAGRRRSQRSVI